MQPMPKLPDAVANVRDERFITIIVSIAAAITFSIVIIIVAILAVEFNRGGANTDNVAEEYAKTNKPEVFFARLNGKRGKMFQISLDDSKAITTDLGLSNLVFASKSDVMEMIDITAGQFATPAKYMCQIASNGSLALIGTNNATNTIVKTPIQAVMAGETTTVVQKMINSYTTTFTEDSACPEDTPYVALLGVKPTKSAATAKYAVMPFGSGYWSIHDVATRALAIQNREHAVAAAAGATAPPKCDGSNTSWFRRLRCKI